VQIADVIAAVEVVVDLDLPVARETILATRDELQSIELHRTQASFELGRDGERAAPAISPC
jgi:hypothetical protein